MHSFKKEGILHKKDAKLPSDNSGDTFWKRLGESNGVAGSQ